MESAEIPVIDSHHVHILIEAVQFPFMMDFHQHFQVKLVGRVCRYGIRPESVRLR